jgi:hypothetical protein
MKLDALTTLTDEELTAIVAPTLQRYLSSPWTRTREGT